VISPIIGRYILSYTCIPWIFTLNYRSTYALNLPTIRSKFPILKRPAIFFDNPGGTQVAQSILNHVNTYLVEQYANHGSSFTTSLRKCAFGYIINSYPSCNETGFGISRNLHINPQSQDSEG